MEHIPPRRSYLRLGFIDYFRDYGLYVRCMFNRETENQTCTYLVTRNDLFYIFIYTLVLHLVLILLYYCSKIHNHVRNIIFTLLTVEFLAQYVVSLSLPFKIDALTIYWLVWQCMSLVLNWIWLVHLPPIRIIEQGSFCVIMALTAWTGHYIFFRYMSLALNLSVLWILSILDIVVCLRYGEELYYPDLTNQTLLPRAKSRSGFYYIKGVDKWTTSASLGCGDFLVYNILVLFALPPFSSITTKIWVTSGTIISVQIGSLFTSWLRSLVKKLSAPGVPLPVITVSLYLFILDIIIPNQFNQCIKL